MPGENVHPVRVLLAGGGDAAMAALQPAAEMLASFGIDAETRRLTVEEAADLPRSWLVMVVASPDATLPAALAQRTGCLVVRIPSETDGKRGAALLNDGADNLPAGPVNGVFATMAIGATGAKNAALFVVATLALEDARLRQAWAAFRAAQTEAVLRHPPLTIETDAAGSVPHPP